MGTTPLWVPLFVAGMGLLTTLAGTVLGVVLTTRNANNREELRWKRDHDHQRDLWAREDGLRTFIQRQEAYIDFYTKVRESSLRIYQYGYEGKSQLEADWQLPAYESLLRLKILGIEVVAKSAATVYSSLMDWQLAQAPGDEDPYHEPISEENDFDSAMGKFVEAVRIDLGVDIQSSIAASKR